MPRSNTELLQELDAIRQSVQTHLSSANALAGLVKRRVATDKDKEELVRHCRDVQTRLATMEGLLDKMGASTDTLSSGAGLRAGSNGMEEVRLLQEFVLGAQQRLQRVCSSGKVQLARTGAELRSAMSTSASASQGDEEMRAMGSADAFVGGYMQQQEALQREQDEHLDLMSHGMNRLRVQADDIGDEMQQQHDMLNNLDTEVNTVADRLRAANKRLDHIMANMSEKKKVCCIVILCFILGGLIAYFFFGTKKK